MNPDLQHIIQSKEAERRRLRALPWLEKLEMLDRLRERHLRSSGCSRARRNILRGKFTLVRAHPADEFSCGVGDLRIPKRLGPRHETFQL